MKQTHIVLTLILFFIAQMSMQAFADSPVWSFDEPRALGEPPAGWEDASSAGSAHTYSNTTFDGRSCLYIKTTGGTSDRVKVSTSDLFQEGTYDWVVYVPAINEPGARSSIGAFLYSPESSGNSDAREVDFEIGYGSAATRSSLSIPADKLVCYMTVQGDNSSGTSPSSTIIPIDPASWYTLRITISVDLDGDYIARWFIKKEGEEFIESRSPHKCLYGINDTTFKVYASLETLNFIGDFQPTTDKEVYFDSVSVSTAPLVAEYNEVFNDNFDSESAGDSINPVGYNVYGYGTLDKGVTFLYNESAPNSAYLVVGMTTNGSFRSILLHDTIPAVDMTGGTISAQIFSETDLSSFAGVAGFHLYDADGTEAGTMPADRFAPSTSFGLFSQDVSALTNIIVGGSDFVFDTTNIVRYAIDFFDPNDAGAGEFVVVYIDDFKGAGEVVVPPPYDGDVNLGISTIGPQAIELSWFAGNGSSYQAQYSMDLLATNWINVGDAVAGSNLAHYVSDSITNGVNRFYRIKIVQ